MSEGRSGPGAASPAAGRSVGRLVPAAAALLLAACGGDGPTENGNGTVEGLDLSVGEVAVRATGGEVLRLELPADRVHEVAAQVNGAPSAGRVPMRLKVAPTAGASGSAAPSSSASPLVGRDLLDERWTRAADLAGRLKIQESAKRLLQRRNVRPARGAPASSSGDLEPSFSSMLPDSEPAVGQEVKFWYPVQQDFSIECDTALADTVTAQVKAVGQRAIMVEDTAVDDAASLQMDYQALADEFDAEIFGTDVEYFGQPTDIDGNGKVYVLFTTKVNELTDPDDDGIVTGFFLPTDLAESGDDQKEGASATSLGEQDGVCEASNEAEVLFLLAPDPDGTFGKTVDVDQARRSARGTSAHEFQHLLNTGNRVIKQSTGTFADLEDTWLDEALSHLAEEVVGLTKTGDPVRDNLTLARVTESQDEVDAFNLFHLPNFARLAAYMRGPDTTEVLALRDPQGAESLRMRGFVWAFLRWLTDQEATASVAAVPGSGEESFIRDLAQADGGLETGVANVEAATGRSWTTLLEDFGLVPAVDDTVAGVDPRVTLPTWDLRDVFLGLNQNEGSGGSFPQPYPLAYTTPGFSSTTTVNFEVDQGTQKYFRFDGRGAASSVTLELTDQSGAPLGTSTGALLLIVRTR